MTHSAAQSITRLTASLAAAFAECQYASRRLVEVQRSPRPTADSAR